ncbi:hypothetical protein RJZ57_005033 [Blastomyces gilchristii]
MSRSSSSYNSALGVAFNNREWIAYPGSSTSKFYGSLPGMRREREGKQALLVPSLSKNVSSQIPFRLYKQPSRESLEPVLSECSCAVTILSPDCQARVSDSRVIGFLELASNNSLKTKGEERRTKKGKRDHGTRFDIAEILAAIHDYFQIKASFPQRVSGTRVRSSFASDIALAASWTGWQ